MRHVETAAWQSESGWQQPASSYTGPLLLWKGCQAGKHMYTMYAAQNEGTEITAVPVVNDCSCRASSTASGAKQDTEVITRCFTKTVSKATPLRNMAAQQPLICRTVSVSTARRTVHLLLPTYNAC